MASVTARSLEAMPVLVIASVFSFAGHAELHALERVSRLFSHAVRCDEMLWAKQARSAAVLSDEDAPSTVADWKKLACFLTRAGGTDDSEEDDAEPLLENVVDCSSMDSEEESPSNTLEKSVCWLCIKVKNMFEQNDFATFFQYKCGCAVSRACYWSTTPSIDKNAEDFIDYTVRPQSCVDRVELIPYCAYWHPESPTYGPCAASVSFYARPRGASDDSADRVFVYRSPVFPLENTTQLHACALPERVLLPNGGIMRLHLHGRQQQQTIPTESASQPNVLVHEFYTCLSFVGAVGATLRDD